MAEVKKLKNDELEKVSGGNDGTNYSYDWTYGQVHDVVDYGAGSCLPLRNYPNGDVLKTNDGNIMGRHCCCLRGSTSAWWRHRSPRN